MEKKFNIRKFKSPVINIFSELSERNIIRLNNQIIPHCKNSSENKMITLSSILNRENIFNSKASDKKVIFRNRKFISDLKFLTVPNGTISFMQSHFNAIPETDILLHTESRMIATDSHIKITGSRIKITGCRKNYTIICALLKTCRTILRTYRGVLTTCRVLFTGSHGQQTESPVSASEVCALYTKSPDKSIESCMQLTTNHALFRIFPVYHRNSRVIHGD